MERWYECLLADRQATAQVVELTREGVAFLQQRFRDFDKDRDGRLSRSEQDDMFACAPLRWPQFPPFKFLILAPRAPQALPGCLLAPT